jgi:hypothetical protein
MKAGVWLIGVLAVLTVQTTIVNASTTEKVVKADNKASFAVVMTEVQKQLEPGGRYQFATEKERAVIISNLGDMQSLFDKFGTVSAMDQNSKVQLFNDQELVNATLTRRDSNRLVCEHTAPLGSMIPRTTCRTYGQIQASQRDTLHYLDTSRQTQVSSGTSLPSAGGGH